LTFFFRQMPEIIERGYLYIAQPPLYKYKKGKTERYLKDEKELTEFLCEAGMSGLTIDDAQNRGIDLTTMRSLILKLNRFEDLILMSSRKRAPELTKILVSFDPTEITESFNNQETAEAFAKNIEERLVARYGKEDTIYVDSEVVFSEESARFRIIMNTRIKNRPRKNEIDSATANSSDIQELRRILKQIDDVAQAPYSVSRIQTDADTREQIEISTVADLRDHVLESGRKGSYIQRYKGLGEMNPDQLDETTMNVDRRNLLQVEIDDAIAADQIFTTLMGDNVEPRREFIQDNALNVRNLDI